MNRQFLNEGTQKLESYASKFTLDNTLEALDLFKRPLPAFNMRGRTHVPSLCGAFVSVLMCLVVTVYGLSKFIQMMSRNNPNIASWLDQGALEPEESIKFRDN